MSTPEEETITRGGLLEEASRSQSARVASTRLDQIRALFCGVHRPSAIEWPATKITASIEGAGSRAPVEGDHSTSSTDLGDLRTARTTVWPARASSGTRREPIKPLAPATRTSTRFQRPEITPAFARGSP